MPGHHPVSIKLGFKVSPFPPSHFIAECIFEVAHGRICRKHIWQNIKIISDAQCLFALTVKIVKHDYCIPLLLNKWDRVPKIISGQARTFMESYFQVLLYQSINQFGTSGQAISTQLSSFYEANFCFFLHYFVHFKSKHDLPNLQLSNNRQLWRDLAPCCKRCQLFAISRLIWPAGESS